MTTISSLVKEFEREARTTRKHLERLPDDKLAWRPHEKSFPAGMLASHIVECIRWTDSIFSHDELDIDPTTFSPYRATSSVELLATFDADVAVGKRAMERASDADIVLPWRLKIMGRQRFERSKEEVFRDFTLSHLIHHRGQFSVYLRLLDIPVPGSYGPTADEAS